MRDIEDSGRLIQLFLVGCLVSIVIFVHGYIQDVKEERTHLGDVVERPRNGKFGEYYTDTRTGIDRETRRTKVEYDL